jgi:hypothetical protein
MIELSFREQPKFGLKLNISIAHICEIQPNQILQYKMRLISNLNKRDLMLKFTNIPHNQVFILITRLSYADSLHFEWIVYGNVDEF